MATNENIDVEFENTEKIRNIQKEIQKSMRQEKREGIINRKRKYLSEIQRSFSPVTIEEMEELALNLVKSKDNPFILQQIRRGALCGELQIQAFLSVSGAMEKLVGKLCGRNAELQLEAAACIANLATGSHKSTQRVARAAGAYLVTHMKGDSHFLQDQCAWAAGNIVNDCKQCFLIMNMQGLLPALQSLLSSTCSEVVQSALFSLNGCLQYESTTWEEMVKNGLSNELMGVIVRGDISHQVLVDAMFAFWNISEKVVEFLTDVEQQKIVLTILNHAGIVGRSDQIDVMLMIPVVRCLGVMSTGSTHLCNMILNSRAFQEMFTAITKSDYNFLQKELLWVLSNLLNYAESDNSENWSWSLEWIKPFLSPINDNAIQVLYFLCLLKSTKRNFDDVFTQSELPGTVMTLSNCGKVELETAAAAFLTMLNTSVLLD